MKFENSESPANVKEISEIESRLDLNLPVDLKKIYMTSNGGSPELYVFEDENVDTVVANFLPITSSGARTAVDVYSHLVIAQAMVPKQYFPFAVDGGGDYFFIDCSAEIELVYLFRSDAPKGESGLVCLNTDLAGFLARLKEE